MAYSEETKKRALDLYQQGYKSEQISKLLGLSGGQTRKWIRVVGISRGSKCHPVFIKEQAKKLYYQGIRVREISVILNVKRRTIYDWLGEKLPRFGNRASHWKGGINPINLKIRKSDKMNEWRLQIFERDNFTCVCCGETGGKLQAHHILSFSKFPNQRFNVKNGVTLCVDCHHKLHSKRKTASEA